MMTDNDTGIPSPNDRETPTVYKLPAFTNKVCSAIQRQKVLTVGQKRAIVDAVFNDMIQYTRYPKRDFYNAVCSTLVMTFQYQYSNDDAAKQHTMWKRTLINKFKNSRRKQGGNGNNGEKRIAPSGKKKNPDKAQAKPEKPKPSGKRNSSRVCRGVWTTPEWQKVNENCLKVENIEDESNVEQKSSSGSEEAELAQLIDTYPSLQYEKELVRNGDRLPENSTSFAGTKTCLLIIGERRKKLTFNGDKIIDVKREVACTEEFINLINVNTDIFQIYDADFEEYIDASNDTTVCDKCKIKVVRDVNTMICNQNNTSDLEQSNHPELIPVCIYEATSSVVCDDGMSTNESLNLPNDKLIPVPYNVPEFSFDISNTLKYARNLTPKQRSIIIDTLYQDMLQYTIYPPRSFYDIVANALVSRYPHLQDALGVPSMSWKLALINKFKYERRKLMIDAVLKQRKKYGSQRKNQQPFEQTPVRVSRSVADNYPDNDNDDAGDEVDIESHQVWMAAEFKKSRKNFEEISKRMEATYSDRKTSVRILAVDDIVKKYPCIQLEHEFLSDFERLTSRNAYDRILGSFLQFFNPVYEKGKKKLGEDFKNRVLDTIAEKTTEGEQTAVKCIAAFLYIVRLLKEDPKYIFHVDKKVGPPQLLTPTLVLQSEDVFNPGTIHLYVNGIRVLSPRDFLMGVICLFAAYWVFHIKYHTKIASTMNFIEHLCCEIKGTMPKPKVINMANWLLKT